ncbi:hypothetical protein BX600DRAFT_477722 [Xylariales sp. PMI_506]|nr:hypothetical protein BX600DRAFT_477722 [Xylariales sp. PMI_506]
MGSIEGPLSTKIKWTMSQSELVHRRSSSEAYLDTPVTTAHHHRTLMSLHAPGPRTSLLYLPESVASSSCSTDPRNSRHHQTHLVPRADSSSPVNPMSRLPPPESVKTVISRNLPNTTIESIKPISPYRPQRDFTVQVSDGRTVVLTLSPSRMLRLLRSEQCLVLSEALIIRWMYQKLLEDKPRNSRMSIQSLLAPEPQQDPSTSMSTTSLGNDHISAKSKGGFLLSCLPVLLAHSISSPELGTAFNFFEQSKGCPVISLPEPLSAAEQKVIDFQKGQLVRRISGLSSPNSKFGPVAAVLGSSPASSDGEGSIKTAVTGSGGVGSWTKAFLALVEGVLRDGEDLAVMMSYSLIRGHVRRLSHLLDTVTLPRLVVMDAGNDSNLLVDRSPINGDQDTMPKHPSRPSSVASVSISDASETAPTTPAQGVKTTNTQEAKGSLDKQGMAPMAKEDLQNASRASPQIVLTGLRDWSNSIFGDPLMACIFSQNPSPEFLDGFRQRKHPTNSPYFGASPSPPPIPSPLIARSSSTAPSSVSVVSGDGGEEEEEDEVEENNKDDDDDDGSDQNDGRDDYPLIEDREHAAARLLLYECYHAAVSLVRTFYRPCGGRDNATRDEMAARRRLTAVLNRLAEVDDDGNDGEGAHKRPRKESVDIWPVKRPKS